MKYKSAIFAVLLAGFSQTNVQSAFAAESGWITSDKIKPYMASLFRSKQMPTSLKCKNNPDKYGVPLFKVTSKSNPGNYKWRWYWGTAARAHDNRLRSNNYEQVSDSPYQGLGGVRQHCVLWVRKGSGK